MGLFSKNKDKVPIKSDARSTSVRVVVLFSGVPDFDPKEYAKLFSKLWNKKISCDPAPAQGDLNLGIKRFQVMVEGARLSLALIGMPLERSLVGVIDRMTSMSALSFQLSEIQSKALRDHVTHVIIETPVIEDLEKPMEGIARAWSMMEMVITLLEQFDGFVGYVPVSAQVYHPKEWLQDMVKSRQIQQSDLFILLGNMHLVSDTESWVHTHGMEQFGLPDIEARFRDRDMATRYTNLVGDAAMYTIDSAVITVGNTLELSGDGVVYRIVIAKEEPDHSFGAFGAIGIERK